MLGRSLDDMPPQTRRLLLMVDAMVTAECERQRIEREPSTASRGATCGRGRGWGDSQLKRHLGRLEELEYLIAHRGGRGQSFVYELYFDGTADAARHTLPGTGDTATTARSPGLEGQKSGPSPAQVRGVSGGGAGEKSPVSMRVQGHFYENEPKNTVREETEENRHRSRAGCPYQRRRSRNCGGEVMARVKRNANRSAHASTPLAGTDARRTSTRSQCSNYSEYTVRNRAMHIALLPRVVRGARLTEPVEVTRPVLERYQRYLFHYRKRNGEPLSFRSQHARLVPLARRGSAG